jgi:hypothetical protein
MHRGWGWVIGTPQAHGLDLTRKLTESDAISATWPTIVRGNALDRRKDRWVDSDRRLGTSACVIWAVRSRWRWRVIFRGRWWRWLRRRHRHRHFGRSGTSTRLLGVRAEIGKHGSRGSAYRRWRLVTRNNGRGSSAAGCDGCVPFNCARPASTALPIEQPARKRDGDWCIATRRCDS